MNEQVNPITIIKKNELAGREMDTVDGRSLHQFLKIKIGFNDWIRLRITQFKFIRDRDYLFLSERTSDGLKQNNYYLTLDMAKELALIERSDKGREVRAFISRHEHIGDWPPPMDDNPVFTFSPPGPDPIIITAPESPAANQLIRLSQSSINQEQVNTVNARDLHAFLEVGKVFGAWITERISQFDFVENQDFIVVSEIGKNPKGGRPSKEYHLSLDMAKELSMVERNEKGKQARQYFIDCERKAKAAHTLAAQPVDMTQALNDKTFLRTALLTYTEKVMALEEENKTLTPKAAALDRISTADGMICITVAAKYLQVKPRDLFAWLSKNKWIYRKAPKKPWVAYQPRIDEGLLTQKVSSSILTSTGREIVLDEQVMVTPKGLSKLSMIFSSGEVAA